MCGLYFGLTHFDQLLEYEPRAGEQVPLLLRMQEDELALRKVQKMNNE